MEQHTLLLVLSESYTIYRKDRTLLKQSGRLSGGGVIVAVENNIIPLYLKLTYLKIQLNVYL